MSNLYFHPDTETLLFTDEDTLAFDENCCCDDGPGGSGCNAPTPTYCEDSCDDVYIFTCTASATVEWEIDFPPPDVNVSGSVAIILTHCDTAPISCLDCTWFPHAGNNIANNQVLGLLVIIDTVTIENPGTFTEAEVNLFATCNGLQCGGTIGNPEWEYFFGISLGMTLDGSSGGSCDLFGFNFGTENTGTPFICPPGHTSSNNNVSCDFVDPEAPATVVASTTNFSGSVVVTSI